MHRKTAVLLALALLAPMVHGAEINLVDQLEEGGIAILVTLGLSILFVAVTLERLVRFRAKAVIAPGLIDQVRPLWNSPNRTALHAVLDEHDSTLARIVAFMSRHRDQPHAFVSSGAGDIASLELRQHQQKAYALAIVATVAPIVGLLGTVIGMIESFHVIAYSGGMGNPALLAGGISKALVNTAAGLAVALPALGMHHYFRHRMMGYGLALEKQVNQLLEEWFVPQSSVKKQPVLHAH